VNRRPSDGGGSRRRRAGMETRLGSGAAWLVRTVRLAKSAVWRALPMRYRFQRIYRYGQPGDQDESRSGPGSSLRQTAAIRASLPALLEKLSVRSVLDIPCGDFHWMKEVDLAGVAYIGADIVPAVIAMNQRAHGDGAARRFVTLNITSDPLPKVDLVLSRDCLVHLSNRDVRAALENVRRSGSTYLLTTTFPAHAQSPDIMTGHWRPINLELPPFGLPRPVLMIDEKCPEPGYQDKSLGLWRVDEMG
jgi:SAM-dependent methyltransferase